MITILAVASAGSAAVRTAHPIVGKWSIEYERGRVAVGGDTQSITGQAVLEVVQRGDSLLGTFVPDDMRDGRSMPPRASLAGAGVARAATLTSSSTERVMTDGDTRTIVLESRWELLVSDDSITGTIWRSHPGLGPSSIRGIRIR